jgi:hypothetical protein
MFLLPLPPSHAQNAAARWFVTEYTEQGRPIFHGPFASLPACEATLVKVRSDALAKVTAAERKLVASQDQQRSLREDIAKATSSTFEALRRQIEDADRQGLALEIELRVARDGHRRVTQSAICERR